MQTFESLIPLTWWQQAIFLGICAWVIIAARPEVALAIYLSIASWTRGFLIGPLAQIWVLLLVMGLAVLRLILFRGIKPFILPQHKRGIVLWITIWWTWMILLFLIFRSSFEPGSTEALYKNTILYTLIPLPIILLLPKQVDRIVYFAWAYILTAAIGGILAIMMLNIPFAYLLIDPTSVTRKSFALGLYNYHWFAYQFAISLVFIFSLFAYLKNLLARVSLGLLALLCVYFLLLSSSRQSILGSAIALMFCFVWVEFSGRGAHRLWVVVLVVVVVVSAFWLIQRAPDVLRIGLSSSGTASFDQTVIREILQKRSQVSWEQGFALFPDSPIWGLGFSKYYISHNLFLGTLVDQGIVGLIFLLGFLVFWLGEVAQAWQTSTQPKLDIWKLAMVAVMVFVLVQSQFSGNPLTEWAMWWSTAFLWCLNGIDELHEDVKQIAPLRGRSYLDA